MRGQGSGSGSGRHRESKSGAIAIEAAVTGADVRSPLATSWLFDKRGLFVEIFSFCYESNF